MPNDTLMKKLMEAEEEGKKKVEEARTAADRIKKEAEAGASKDLDGYEMELIFRQSELEKRYGQERCDFDASETKRQGEEITKMERRYEEKKHEAIKHMLGLYRREVAKRAPTIRDAGDDRQSHEQPSEDGNESVAIV